MDFPRQPVTITIPPSNILGRDFQGSVSIEIDMINEPDEIFLLLVEPTEDTANDAEAPNIIFENNGLSIARIVDDDGQLFSFPVSTSFLFYLLFFLFLFLFLFFFFLFFLPLSSVPSSLTCFYQFTPLPFFRGLLPV